MQDLILFICSTLFFILFIFLFFIFAVFIISLFKKKYFDEFKPFISIIIPAFNEEKNILACIDSITSSNYPQEQMEIIVVDDGSTDNTLKILKSQKVRILNQNHKGKSEALNLGVTHSNHDYILCIDADSTLEKNSIANLVKPLKDPGIGATTGSSVVKNNKGVLGIFQNIEYHYNNLIRYSFSRVFNTGIWFFGALACYKKDVLIKIGLFKKDTLTEDMDIALEIHNAGYRTYHVHKAICYTIVPTTIKSLYSQRSRWWMGVLQSLNKNKKLFSNKSSPSIIFLFVNQIWWSFYALLSLPVIIFMVNYWLPYNTDTLINLFGYLFRWFSLAGPFYVIYMIPIWGLNYHNFFGVFSGIISSILIIFAILMYKDRVNFKNSFALFFYFPYTIILNMIIMLSLSTYVFRKKRYFIG